MKPKKILSWSSLKRRLAAERKKKQTIVFTNGCFDLLHVGHLRVFERCKQLGDVLVLGVNSDRSVRRIKGPSRPLMNEKERASLLSAFEPIDYVVIFNEDTPERLIKLVTPDVLVKGGDWKAADIVGRGVAKRVVRIPLVKGRSTSNLIDLILKRYGK